MARDLVQHIDMISIYNFSNYFPPSFEICISYSLIEMPSILGLITVANSGDGVCPAGCWQVWKAPGPQSQA